MPGRDRRADDARVQNRLATTMGVTLLCALAGLAALLVAS